MANRNIRLIFVWNLKLIIMENLIRLTNTKGEPILIGTESIISVEEHTITDTQGNKTPCRKIDSRGAMVSRFYVLETMETIYNKYKKR